MYSVYNATVLVSYRMAEVGVGTQCQQSQTCLQIVSTDAGMELLGERGGEREE